MFSDVPSELRRTSKVQAMPVEVCDRERTICANCGEQRLATTDRAGIVSGPAMLSRNHNPRRKGAAGRRVVVLAVPPVDEFDLVCPVQVFSAANRLGGKPIYAVEIATNGKDLKVQGEAGRLSVFLASALTCASES